MNIDLSKYKVVNGTYYRAETPDEVCQVLERARENRVRLAIAFKAESENRYGRVGRSLGPVKVPLLVHNARSLGGDELWADGIVEIRESQSKRLLYVAPGRDAS